ncbi:hypothetical protein A3F03_02775 [Candidatus Roizmanbacteria bacterium RIFCSPHIGHO2_12_FULL_41_11]|uniref:Ketosynthase family 3 (KS3) domain-containing protein n=1 Tax=Candidatus Roizmanbacteria bacterium RIFCSPHIGHO2_12_FULL_41_11 TaxID=1802052 RepID=A0A1F7I2A5_9BACT|nr:MAG: hypothetical protein A3F03_02775 [Candidatus Roizmanbacteria bacterium RIFCSPHIGHO2_12_FULL_41_11]
MGSSEMISRAQELGVELEERPSQRIVITGFAALTPLGNTEETWQGLLEGKSGVKKFPVDNAFVDIAAPVDFNPEDHFTKREMRGKSVLHAMGMVLAREAARHAGLIGEDGKLKPDINRRRTASWVGSGYGFSDRMIDVYNKIHEKDNEGKENPQFSSRHISPFIGLELFPEQLNANIAQDLGLQGWGGSSVEACATGLGNIVEAIEKVKTGRLKVAIAGGVENTLVGHPEVGIGIFAGMKGVLSKRNDEPHKASRPFDTDRDGFVFGAGGGIVVVEDLEHALRRGAKIYAEILGFRKSMDGGEPTNIDIENVAQTMLKALYDESLKTFRDVDVIFAHATSTAGSPTSGNEIRGDIREAEALRMVFGKKLREIPITANKGNIGHLAAGSGPVSLIEAILTLNSGLIPPILNLENPDSKVSDLNLVRGKSLNKDVKTALVPSYGFGGNNAVVLLGKFEE